MWQREGVGRAKASDEREEAFTKLELQKEELELHYADRQADLEDAKRRIDALEEENGRLNSELKADGHVFHYRHHK